MSTSAPQRFSWNLAGIVGAAIGMSLWMPVSAALSGWPRSGVSVAIAAMALILATAATLWIRRHRLSAFRGVLVLLLAGCIATLLFLLTANMLDLEIVLGWPEGRPSSPMSVIWILLLYPLLAVVFWLLNRRTKGSEQDATPNGGPAVPVDNPKFTEGRHR